MADECLVFVRGLHLPWNQGEVVLAKSFVELLAKVYESVRVVGFVDFVRGFEGFWQNPPDNVEVVYLRGVREVKSYCRGLNVSDKRVDVHFLNYSLCWASPSLLLEARRVFVYQFALQNVRALSTFFRVNALSLASTVVDKLYVVTTSPQVYSYVMRLGFRRVYYIPAPLSHHYLSIGEHSVATDSKSIVYLGHPDLARFPIHKLLPVFIKLARKGFEFEFRVYLSKIGYKDYEGFYKVLKRVIERYGLSSRIVAVLKNLSDEEKYAILRSSNIFLFPALTETAVDPPLSVLEAMVFGCCVIATNVQSLPYILRNGRGITLDKNDLPIELFRVVTKFLRDDSYKIHEIKRKAREYAIRYHIIAPLHILSQIINSSS